MKNMTREALELNSRFNARHTDNGDGTVTARVMGSFDLVVDPADQSVARHLIKEGYWEAWISTWFVNNYDPDALFIDIGANTGYYSFLAAAMEGTAMAFEPNPAYVKMLYLSRTRNTNANVSIHPFAVADKPGTLTLSVPGNLHGSASVVHDFDGQDWFGPVVQHTVKAVTLDQQLDGLDRPYLLKIDAESAEEMIWDGGRNALGSDVPGLVMLEWTPNSYSNAFMDKLLDYGDISFIDFSGQEQPVTTEWLDAQVDWVMLVIRKH